MDIYDLVMDHPLRYFWPERVTRFKASLPGEQLPRRRLAPRRPLR